jgi:hypothetical protein
MNTRTTASTNSSRRGAGWPSAFSGWLVTTGSVGLPSLNRRLQAPLAANLAAAFRVPFVYRETAPVHNS